MEPSDGGSDGSREPSRGTAAAGTTGRETPGGGPERSRLDRSLAFTRRHLVLALVPLATALLAVEDLRRTAAMGGLSLRFSFPFYRADLWTFVGRPTTAGVDVALPSVFGQEATLLVPVVAAYVVVSGTLSAGYFGSIAEALETGTFDFAANVRRYALRTIALEVLVLAALATLFVAFAAAPGLLLIGVLAGFVAAYFLFPTIYVLVLEDRAVLDAIDRAVALVKRHQPIGFVLQVALAAGACSVVLSSLARSSVAGAVAAAVLAAPLGLAFNVHVMQYVAELGGVGPSIRGRVRR